MKGNKLSGKISMKWKVFGYFLGFVGILLVLLWVLQIVYLDTFYKSIKEKELKKAASYVQKNLESEDLEDILYSLDREYDVSVLIADMEGNALYKTAEGNSEIAFMLNTEEFKAYCERARAAGGELDIFFGENLEGENPDKKYLGDKNPKEIAPKESSPKDESFRDEELANRYIEGETPGNRLPYKDIAFRKRQEPMERMMGIRLVDTSEGMRVILLESLLSPVDATIHTLRTQLLLVSVIMAVLALGLAFLLSKTISKSIIRVNRSAKRLGKGDFQVEFDARDYKEIAELSDTLNKAARDLAKVEGLQRELIANVSHDLRTPLTMIIAYSEVMRDIPGENTAENLQVVIEEAERLSNLVNDMLDVSKLQAGVVKLEKEVFDLTANVERVLERYAKLKEQDGYQISFSYDQHVMVEADSFKLSQVLYNLINNAIHYTGEDKVVQVLQTTENHWVTMEIKDTGEGIGPEELENVWERYYKVDKNHKRAISGTGLGLSIVKNILKLHQAEFGVESTPGKGSNFWFRLPVKEEAAIHEKN